MSESPPSSVVLITVDCLRADHVGCYGYDRPTTPQIDSFAERATVFERAYSNCPGTRWALQSLHMGVWAHQIKGLGVPDIPGVALAAQLQSSGYATGGFVHNGFLTRDYGYDSGFDRFDDVHTFREDQNPVRRFGGRFKDLVNSELLRQYLASLYGWYVAARQRSGEAYRPDITDQEVTTNAIEWITSQQRSDRRFFAWLHLMDAHTPYARWDDHLQVVRGDTAVEHVIHPRDLVAVGEEPPPSVIDAYDAGIRSADQQVGRVLRALDQDAVVIVTGDHGEEFGRYNPFHKESLYSSYTQVPIIMYAPGIERGRIDEYPAQHLDIPPTIVRSIGGDSPPQYVGQALQQVDRDRNTPIYFCVGTDWIGVRCGEWKYITKDSKTDGELYYSPYGIGDEAEFSGQPPIERSEFTALLEQYTEWMDENEYHKGKQSLEEGASELSDAVRTNLEELGYLE